MRHPVTTFLSALMVVTATVSTLSAQTKPPSAAQVQHTLPTNRWVTKPTLIGLTVHQRKALDSISARYAAEELQVSKQVNGQSDMNMVLKMMNLSSKYQNIVRGILNPAQQAVFDKNIRTSVFGP